MIRFLIVYNDLLYIVFEIKNAFKTLKASFGLENKNMKPSKKNDVLMKKKVYCNCGR